MIPALPAFERHFAGEGFELLRGGILAAKSLRCQRTFCMSFGHCVAVAVSHPWSRGCALLPCRAVLLWISWSSSKCEQLVLGLPAFRYSHVDETRSDVDRGLILRREARLMLQLPVLALAAEPWTTCTSGPPMLLYVVYLATPVRGKWCKYGLLRQVEVPFRFSMLFGLRMGIWNTWIG